MQEPSAGAATGAMPVSQAMQHAEMAYGRGEWGEAERWCRQILAARGDVVEALHLLGIITAQTQRAEEAARLLARVVEANPGQAMVHNNYGNVLKDLRRFDAALDSYERALKIEPGYAEAHNNRGNALRQLKRFDEALVSYDRALALRPDYAEAHYNRGNVLRQLKRPEEALASYDRALALRADYVEALYNRGNMLNELGRLGEAVASYETALAFNPRAFNELRAFERLGSWLHNLGRIEQAAGVYRKWLELEPANPVAQHLYAAASGENVPKRASDEYVSRHFDRFAQTFDAVLAKIDYAVPQLLHEALMQRVGRSRGGLLVLDAGCGTGLCGVLLRSTAKYLAGVDLSPQMLAKAHARNVYDELFEGELCAFMASRPGEFDLVMCADTLVYFGALAEPVAAARRSMRANGVFGFSVEALPEDASTPFTINAHGRYAHTRAYLCDIMEASGFSAVQCTPVVVRKQFHADVNGYLVTGSVPG